VEENPSTQSQDYYYYDDGDTDANANSGPESSEDQQYQDYVNYYGYGQEDPGQYYPEQNLDGRIRDIRKNDGIFR
jgi:hypothetical protein